MSFWKGNVSELYSFNVTLVIVSIEWCGEEWRGEGTNRQHEDVRSLTVPFWKGNISELYNFNVTMVIYALNGVERIGEETGQTDSMKM